MNFELQFHPSGINWDDLFNLDIIDPCAHKFTPKWWENPDLEQYAVLGAEALESTDIVRLGENMMIGLTIRDFQRLHDIIAVLAVHIRKADWSTRLIPAELLADKQKQIESLTDLVFLEKLERETGRLDCLQVTRKGVTPLVLRDTKERTKILGAPASMLYGDTRENILGAFITSIRKWDVELQACWYAFLAACICRVFTKTPAAVRKLVTGVLFTRFRQFYGAPLIQTPVPEPGKNNFDSIAMQLRSCRSLCKFVITSFLKGLKLAVVEKDTRCRGILEFSLLVHTLYNGLQLIGLLHQVMDELGTRDVEYIIQQVGIKETVKGLDLIREYCSRYGTSSRWMPASSEITPNPDEVDRPPFQLWSRLLDDNYLANLRVKDNKDLAAIFCTIIDPDKSEGGVWFMPGLEIDKDAYKFYRRIIKPRVEEIKKNTNKNPM